MASLANKYRPRKISDLLGQDALVRVLTAALETDKVAQAYVFTGIRGTGKTSAARILAMSVNCEHGPTTEPCGECPSCLAILKQGSLDVMELDAASRSGVEHMRELLENVSYAPMKRGAKKIYVIDEAHMLSTAAWNALLKTLEEPPEHVIFVFATTEARKIPATILSRCQSFPLRRIEPDVVAANLHRIAEAEGFALEPSAAMAIARAGEGSMRDSISILDQASSGSPNGSVSLEPVLSMLGKASRADIVRTLGALTTGTLADAIGAWRSVTDAGVEPLDAIDDLMEILHLATLCLLDPSLLSKTDLPPADAETLSGFAGSTTVGHLMSAQRMLVDTRDFVSSNPNRAQAAEILVMRLVSGFAYRKKD